MQNQINCRRLRMNIFITLLAFIATMQQFSVDSNEFSTLSSELLQIAKQNLLSEESVEITEEYY
ncbi:hypothetical protein T06_7782 [Trichinella sp. T6]|nr:hypothetical protein T06_7782 [Trichinella sp. T6]